MSASVRVGLVGAGALGRHHARILAGLDQVDLVGVAEVNPEQGQAVAEQCGTRWYSDYRLLVGRVDAVSIAVPTVAHLAVASEFLSRQIPVLVEKPLAASLTEARTLRDLADRHGTLLQVGHVERFNPATQVAFSAGGSPRYIRSERLSPYSFRSTDIGVVHDLMIHDIDLILGHVQSPVRSIEAFGVCVMGGHEDIANARIRFENGCIADLTSSRLNPTASRCMQIWTAEGTVSVDFTSREVTCWRPTETLLYGTPPLERAAQPGADILQLRQDVFERFITPQTLPVSADDALTAELAHFADCVRENRTPLVDGHAGCLAMEVAQQVLDEIASHQWEGHAAGATGAHPQWSTGLRRAG